MPIGVSSHIPLHLLHIAFYGLSFAKSHNRELHHGTRTHQQQDMNMVLKHSDIETSASGFHLTWNTQVF